MRGLYRLLPADERQRRGREQFDSYFKFGFVRNPWDRTVSLCNRREGLTLKEKMSFDEFVDWINYASATCIHPALYRYQLDWFVEPHGNILVDFIGKFEKLETDWHYVSEKLGIEQVLPKLNVNMAKKSTIASTTRLEQETSLPTSSE